MPVLATEGASKAQRGYIIGLTRKLNDEMGLDSLVVARIERTAKLDNDLSEEYAEKLIDALKEFIEEVKEGK